VPGEEVRVEPRTTPRPAALIRRRRPADLPDCVSVLADTHRTSSYPVDWPSDPAGWLTPRGLLDAWVAELAGVIVGHVALIEAREKTARAWTAHSGRPATAAGEVSRLCVSRAARGRSIGRQLLATADAATRERGLHTVLGVLDESVDAIVLYDKLGWHRMSTVDFEFADGRMTVMHCYAAPTD
jgi:ribosomal protein S18 acetylase RimI-like enzyme